MLYNDLYICFISWPSEACVSKYLALDIKRLGTTALLYPFLNIPTLVTNHPANKKGILLYRTWPAVTSNPRTTPTQMRDFHCALLASRHACSASTLSCNSSRLPWLSITWVAIERFFARGIWASMRARASLRV